MNTQETIESNKRPEPSEQRFTNSRDQQLAAHGNDDTGSIQIVQLETPKESQRNKDKRTVIDTSRTSHQTLTDRKQQDIVMTLQPGKGKAARAIRNSILR